MSSPFSNAQSFSNSFSPSSPHASSPDYVNISRFQIRDPDQLKRDVLPTSAEYDMIRENYFIKDGEDRSGWYAKMLADHPEIQNFIERIDPISRATAFARLYLPPSRLVDQTTLLSLIYQHLRTLGLIETQSSLHNEWDALPQIPNHMTTSQLGIIVQRGVSRAERFWELSMGDNPDVTQQLDEEISTTIGGTPYIVEDATPLSSEQFGDPRYMIFDEETTPSSEALPSSGSPTSSDQVSNPIDTNQINTNSPISPVGGKFIIGHGRTPKEVSLNQLMWLLTTGNDLGGTTLINAICLTYKSFTSSKIFFTKLRERFRYAFSEPDDTQMRSIALTFKLFRAWLKDGAESIEPPVLEAARIFVETELRPRVPSYCTSLFVENQNSTNATDNLLKDAPEVQLGSCVQLWTGHFSLFDIPPIELARQMTIITASHFFSISRIELLDGAWEKPRLKHRAPNVCYLTSQVNRYTCWVQVMILKGQTAKERVMRMAYFVDLIAELEKLNNFFDMLAIYAGFDAPPLYRLKLHRQMLGDVKNKYLAKVEEISLCQNNGKLVRMMQEDAYNRKEPCIPHIVVNLGDIFKYTDSAHALVNGLINLKKCKRMLDLITGIEKFKRNKYSLLPIQQIQEKLLLLEQMDEDSLSISSTDVEKDGMTLEEFKAMP